MMNKLHPRAQCTVNNVHQTVTQTIECLLIMIMQLYLQMHELSHA